MTVSDPKTAARPIPEGMTTFCFMV